ncbi:SEC-C metal-binding domain-containing protein [Methylobacter luteus]|uniref:SEC-C metal-binding domain-containing protein n=1 Tax=Methylobacter luteus TaxID=415 RepID=UPI0004261337|nr:SEC-C metal-binding domain-containing protein [Methylobacter luteus]
MYGGNGLNFFSVADQYGQHNSNLFNLYFAPLDECIDTVLRFSTPIANADRKRIITNLLLDKVVSVTSNIKAETFVAETYSDIKRSPYLRNFLSIRNNGRPLNKLKGIKPNQIRIYSPHAEEDKSEIGAVLHAAFENFVLGISSDLKVDEITGDDYSLSLLKAKGQRVGMPIEGQKAFAQIQEILGVPDVGLAFADNKITAEQLLDLRELKSAENFRKWLSTFQPQNSHEDIVNAFKDSLEQTSIADSYLMKTLRFVITTAIGVQSTPAGIAACALDTFWLNKLFPDKSPRLFLKQIKSVVVKSAEKEKVDVAPPNQSGRDRNRPCSCGSGKKYKKCCGL